MKKKLWPLSSCDRLYETCEKKTRRIASHHHLVVPSLHQLIWLAPRSYVAKGCAVLTWELCVFYNGAELRCWVEQRKGRTYMPEDQVEVAKKNSRGFIIIFPRCVHREKKDTSSGSLALLECSACSQISGFFDRRGVHESTSITTVTYKIINGITIVIIMIIILYCYQLSSYMHQLMRRVIIF